MGEKYRIIKQFEEEGKDVLEELARQIEEHGAVTPIAKKYGVANDSISYHLKRAGYAYRWSRVPDVEIAKKYVELSDEQAVAKHFNIAQSYVHDALLRQLEGEPDA